MAEYAAEVLWLRGEQPFMNNRYSRRHLLRFDGGVEVPASSSPHVVPLPFSDAAAVNPGGGFRRLARELPPAVVPGDRRRPRLSGQPLQRPANRGHGAQW